MDTENKIDPSPADNTALPETPAPRPRGRPKLSDEEKAQRAAAKAALNSGAGDELPPKNNDAPTRRARPISAKAAPKIERTKADSANLAKQVQGLHQLAALGTGLPVLAINEKEAQMLADAIIAVSDEYGLSIDGKTGAAVQLFAALGMVYGPRVVAVVAIKRQKKTEQKVADAPASRANSDTAPTVDLPNYEGDRGNAIYQ